MAVKITFRPMPRQVLGRALLLSFFACAVALPPAVLSMTVSGRWRPTVLAGMILAVILSALSLTWWSARRAGVVLDAHGIHPLERGSGRYARWTRIEEIRAERRGGRTI